MTEEKRQILFNVLECLHEATQKILLAKIYIEEVEQYDEVFSGYHNDMYCIEVEIESLTNDLYDIYLEASQQAVEPS